MTTSFRITQDTLTPSLATMDPRIRAAIDFVFDRFEPIKETYMRSQAPWTDRTGNARLGLRARHEKVGDASVLVIFHTMPYGVYLELAHDGKYAILGPTQRDIGLQMMRVLNAAIPRAMESAA